MEKEKVYNTVSKRYLQVDGQQYKKLIHDGYTQKGDQLLPPITKSKSIKSTSKRIKSIKSKNVAHNIHLPNEMLYEIMLKSDINTIHQYCLTNKECVTIMSK